MPPNLEAAPCAPLDLPHWRLVVYVNFLATAIISRRVGSNLGERVLTLSETLSQYFFKYWVAWCDNVMVQDDSGEQLRFSETERHIRSHIVWTVLHLYSKRMTEFSL